MYKYSKNLKIAALCGGVLFASIANAFVVAWGERDFRDAAAVAAAGISGDVLYYGAANMTFDMNADLNIYKIRPFPGGDGNNTLKFRFDVAMSGRLGLELQPKDMSEDERAFAANAIRCYKEHVRDLVTKGDLYRLVSPYECSDKYAANMYVGKDKDKAVMFAYCTGFNRRGILPVVVFDGLDAEKTYRITEINRNGGKPAFWGDGMTFSGEYLMNAGIELRIARQFESAVFLLEAL